MRAKTFAGLVVLIVVFGVFGAGGKAFYDRVLVPAQDAASKPVPLGGVHSQVIPIYTPEPTTVPRAPKTPASTVPGHPGPSLSVVTALLAEVTPGLQRRVVTTPTAYQAAVYDQAGHIGFWSFLAGRWVNLAQRTYPPDESAGYASYDESGVTVTGALLGGQVDPTYIVAGDFSTDGSGNDVVFTDGPAGWGVVVPTSSGTLASDGASMNGYGPGLYFRADFVGDTLSTMVRPDLSDASFDAAFPVVQRWAWSSEVFVPHSTNIVTATPSKVLTEAASPLPVSGPRSGTYAARVVGVSVVGSSQFPLLNLQLQPGTVSLGCGTGAACFVPDGAVTDLEVGSLVATTYAGYGPAGLVAVTGPAWGVAVPDGLCCTVGAYGSVPPSLATNGDAAWYVPSTDGLTRFADGPEPVLELTFHGNAVTAIAELYSS